MRPSQVKLLLAATGANAATDLSQYALTDVSSFEGQG